MLHVPIRKEKGRKKGKNKILVFFSLAVVASIALFFVSIANLASPGGIYRYGGMQLAAVAGICLTALTYGSASYFWAAVVGFIIAVIGGIFTR